MINLAGHFDDDLIIEAGNLDDADDSVLSIVAEMFPSTATDDGNFASIAAWERVYGLSSETGATLANLRNAVAAKHAAVGGLSIPYFEELAVQRGYTIGAAGATDPHLRITDGSFLPFRADYGRADIDAVYDQDAGASQSTWTVYGTDVESDTGLQVLFEDIKPAWTEIIYVDE